MWVLLDYCWQCMGLRKIAVGLLRCLRYFLIRKGYVQDDYRGQHPGRSRSLHLTNKPMGGPRLESWNGVTAISVAIRPRLTCPYQDLLISSDWYVTELLWVCLSFVSSKYLVPVTLIGGSLIRLTDF